jgi:hypothetical protein
MARYLVVAHQTAASPSLVRRLKDIAAVDANAEFVLLVPATASRHLLTWVEGEGDQIARERANLSAQTLRSAGLRIAAANVGPTDPLEAVRQEHRSRPGYESTIISTLPAGLSRWLHRDLPGQVRRQLGVRVDHVIAGSSATSTATPAAGAEQGVASANGALGLRELAGWRGRGLHCQDGYLADVHEVLYDYVSLEPEWLGLPSRPVPFRTLLVPAAEARVTGDHLSVPMSRDRVLGQPHIDVGQGFASLTDEEQIYNYFGLPFLEVRDVRVLRSGQELPGMEVNVQSITASEISRP